MTTKLAKWAGPSGTGWRYGRRWGRSGLWLLAFCGCQASVQADLKSGGKAGDPELKDFDRPLEASARQEEPISDEGGGADYALLGARHDLSYAGPQQASCKCLAVAVYDQPSLAALQWDLGAPRLDPTSQWIVALSSNQVACDAAPAGTLGASYQGYVVEGNDVVVYVEALGDGRPMTNGAIIPRPLAGGSVLVEAAGSVYGKPLDGKGKRCKLAAPAIAH
jgi:hypothetical protein